MFTIFFSGQTYKYELESITKLFYPVVRFNFEYDKIDFSSEGIVTRLKKGKAYYYLWVRANINGVTKRLSAKTTDFSDCERILCVLLYKVLSQITGIKPTWGILTGIRPVLNFKKLLASGKSEQETVKIMQDDFLLSKESCDKALLTAKVQQKIIFPKNSFSLYVSIPFCKTRCSYCSFVSSSINSKKSLELVDKYIDLLCEELKVTAEITKNKTLDTIYIGGGTPTAISATQLKKVTDTIAKYFPKPREYTIEAGRADTITKEKLEVIKQVANRISINPQSFEDNVLKAVGRAHTAQEVIACYNLARELGFDNINMDFIAGLPTDTVEGFKRSIDKAIELNPENITVHTLSIKRSADLYESVTALDGEIAKQMTDYSHKKLIENGYLPYYLYRQKNNIGNLENIGYCKKGYENIYNILIMDEVQTIVACGAGATTKLVSSTNISRVFNYKYHFEYINMFDEILKRKEEVRNFFKIGDIDSQIKTD